jgi:hypothetical protein
VTDVVAAAEEEAEDGDGVGDVKEDYAGCDHTVGPSVREGGEWEFYQGRGFI